MNRKVAIVAVIFALAVFVRLNSAPYTPPQVEEAEAAHHLTRVDKAAAAFVGAVRSVTGNRATFEPIHVWAMVDGTQCMEFRSQNRFGEMTMQSVVMPAGATRIWAEIHESLENFRDSRREVARDRRELNRDLREYDWRYGDRDRDNRGWWNPFGWWNWR